MRRLGQQDGNASLLMVIMGAGVLLTVLSQSQGLVSHRLQASKVKKVALEGHESDLLALSITKQLISTGTQPLPAVGFKNPLNPNSTQDIELRTLQPNPNPADVAIQADGSVKVVTADVNRLNAQDIDQIFQTKNFTINGPKTSIVVRTLGWDPFPTGYGVQTLYVEAKTTLVQAGMDHSTTLRAKVPLSPPPGQCTIVATSGGTTLAAGATLPSGTAVDVNLRCTGVILQAELLDNGTKISEAGPITAAKDYLSSVPRLLPPRQIAASGNHTLQAVVRLVDGSVAPVADLVFSVTSNADPLVCRRECTCTQWGNGSDCANQTQYADPYPGLAANASLPAPLPNLSANPQISPADFDLLTSWAQTTGMYEPGAHWQGAAFPNYRNVLICADVSAGFDLHAFDPAQNCQRTFVSARGVLGCFREGTMITVRPGLTVPIEKLRPGDTIWNPLRQRTVRLAKVVAGPEAKPLVRFHIGDRQLTVTAGHPLRTPWGYAKASELQPGDLLLLDRRWQEIVSIGTDASRPHETVWNVATEPGIEADDGAIEAEGIASGDLNLQQELEGAARHGH